jgi:hypothetical protein
MNFNFRWKALAALGTLALTSSLFAGPSAKREAKEAVNAVVVHPSDADSMRVEAKSVFTPTADAVMPRPRNFRRG